MEIIKRKQSVRYREQIYIDGKRFRSPCFERKTDAKQWKAQKVSERSKAKILGYEYKVRSRLRFKDFVTEWLESKIKVQRAQSTYNNYKRAMSLHFLPHLGELYLDQITSSNVDKIVSNLLTSGHNENGTNKQIQVLRSVLIEAEKSDVIKRNPLRNYPSLKVMKRPPTYWSDWEINEFLRDCTNHFLYPVYLTALNTGLRRGELAGLCWDKVNFNSNLIEVARTRDRYGLRNSTKTGVTRHVPMNDITKATLLKLFKTRSNQFVFNRSDEQPISVQHLYRDFKRAQKRAGINNEIRFHDLRHTFASHFMMNGGNLYDLQKILGHSKSDMTQVYAHLSPDHLAGTTQILGFHGSLIANDNTYSHDLAHTKDFELSVINGMGG